jgi:fermentation-respiration switch protein FrsA (DUF1100 family)
MMIFLSITTVITAFAAVFLMTYAHIRIYNRPYFGKEHSSQPDIKTGLIPAFIFVKHLENHHWWELWLGSFILRFFCKDNPEPKERKVYANLYLPKDLSTPCPLVVYTHGNGATIEEAATWLEHLIEGGFAVLVPEYRGFGDSGGHPQRLLINKDLCYFFDEAINTGHIDVKNISIYGRSLGGGVACDLINRRSAKNLILESTYFTIKEISGSKHIPDYIFYGKDYECASTVKNFKGNILICHGTRDTVIPVEQSHKLKSLSPKATLELFDAKHADIYQGQDYQKLVLNWLKKH